MQRARAREAYLAVKACSGQLDPKSVSGLSDTLNWIESMALISGDSPAQESKSDSGTRANADASLPEFAH